MTEWVLKAKMAEAQARREKEAGLAADLGAAGSEMGSAGFGRGPGLMEGAVDVRRLAGIPEEDESPLPVRPGTGEHLASSQRADDEEQSATGTVASGSSVRVRAGTSTPVAFYGGEEERIPSSTSASLAPSEEHSSSSDGGGAREQVRRRKKSKKRRSPEQDSGPPAPPPNLSPSQLRKWKLKQARAQVKQEREEEALALEHQKIAEAQAAKTKTLAEEEAKARAFRQWKKEKDISPKTRLAKQMRGVMREIKEEERAAGALEEVDKSGAPVARSKKLPPLQGGLSKALRAFGEPKIVIPPRSPRFRPPSIPSEEEDSSSSEEEDEWHAQARWWAYASHKKNVQSVVLSTGDFM